MAFDWLELPFIRRSASKSLGSFWASIVVFCSHTLAVVRSDDDRTLQLFRKSELLLLAVVMEKQNRSRDVEACC